MPKLRGILAKLIHRSILNDLEGQLSQSNIGARKGFSTRDHVFVLNAVINETLRGKGDSLDLVLWIFCSALIV